MDAKHLVAKTNYPIKKRNFFNYYYNNYYILNKTTLLA